MKPISPRLAFVALSDNLMVLALRAMLSPFLGMIGLAVWCFAGFLYALWLYVSRSSYYPTLLKMSIRLGSKEFHLSEISKYMLWLL